MVAVSLIAAQPGFVVRVVECRGGHRGWSEPEERSRPELVLVRGGWFRRRTRAGIVDADPTLGYLGLPGEEETFAHPAGGDVCTAVRFTPQLWDQLFGGRPPAGSSVYIDAALELAHRRFVAATRQPDVEYALSEHLLELVRTALQDLCTTPDNVRARRGEHHSGFRKPGDPGTRHGPDTGGNGESGAAAENPGNPPPPQPPHPTPHDAHHNPSGHPAAATRGTGNPSVAGGAPDTSGGASRHSEAAARAHRPAGARDRDLAGEARLAIVAGDPAAGSLLSLAGALEVSPFRLSRAFSREVGVSLTHYRNRVRVSRVLARLEAGAADLADLAAELGFADQAHLTRTVHRYAGHPPAHVRRLLGTGTTTAV
ncbi:helix-turn-helix domain-containing protein [Amycolatopsis granulosa]|uniref:helix-turn-helix domain-containing protein n=1 Tax=Amycolatopsis granulosa TaxID=185684 RepID=UPI001FBB6FD5|nr:AraC family transcriptional regulator [Amycolatopsis granulosa]NIH85301.1 AraC-like DNA-binding protein [Amycolatopsis granulosa]